jgi:hypothetical protein
VMVCPVARSLKRFPNSTVSRKSVLMKLSPPLQSRIRSKTKNKADEGNLKKDIESFS